MRNARTILLSATFALWLLQGSAWAASTSFVCTFKPEFKNELVFVVDLDSLMQSPSASFMRGKGAIVGNVGTSDVDVVWGPEAVSFLEPVATGVVQTTTVKLDTLAAIHSRHTIMASGPLGTHQTDFIATQTRGKCERRT